MGSTICHHYKPKEYRCCMGINVRIIFPLDKDGFVWGLGHHLRRNTIIIPGRTSGFGWFSTNTDYAHGTKTPPSASKMNGWPSGAHRQHQGFLLVASVLLTNVHYPIL